MTDPPAPTPPRVVVFGLGGTIAMTMSNSGGVAPALTAAQLVAAVPHLDSLGLDLDVVTFRNRPGASLAFPDLAGLADAIRERLDDGAAGAVVMQGTDTIEETSYLLDLLHDRPEPIIVTGAMRNPTQPGADGPANILAAIRVAASPAARSVGCLVVFNDEIHAASRVRKTHSTSTATFASTTGGPLGYVIEGIPVLVNQPRHRFTIGSPARHAPRIGLHTAVLGDDGTALPALAVDLDGLVVAGFGVGHVPESWADPLTAIARRIPVVLATRAGGGPVLSGTYGFPGSERDLIERGLIPAGLLDAVKARILLHCVLATRDVGTPTDIEAVRRAFGAAGLLGDPADWPYPARNATAAGADRTEASYA